MEKPSLTATFDVGSSHSTAPHGPGGIPSADDSGNVDDPPPIPSAGSSRESVLMNDKSLPGARGTKTTNSITTVDTADSAHISTINAHAHTLTHSSVASVLGTTIE